MGIGSGLINTRDHVDRAHLPHWFLHWLLHYAGYYVLVVVIVSLAALLAPVWLFKRTWNDMSVESLALRALVALVGGFEGWRLSEHTQHQLRRIGR